jgi:hypothetical protein
VCELPGRFCIDVNQFAAQALQKHGRTDAAGPVNAIEHDAQLTPGDGRGVDYPEGICYMYFVHTLGRFDLGATVLDAACESAVFPYVTDLNRLAGRKGPALFTE